MIFDGILSVDSQAPLKTDCLFRGVTSGNSSRSYIPLLKEYSWFITASIIVRKVNPLCLEGVTTCR